MSRRNLGYNGAGSEDSQSGDESYSDEEFCSSDNVESSDGGFEPGKLRRRFQRMFTRKSLEAILREAEADQADEGPKLGLFDLLCIGIGSTIGSGVFVLTGSVLPKAGPATMLSWFVAGAACTLSGMSYMELSSRLPTKGSCYVFSYHGLGEFAAVLGACCLTLEYGISGAGIARSWSSKVAAAIGGNADAVMFWKYADIFRRQRNVQGFYGTNSSAVASGSDDDSDSYMDWVALLIMTASVIVTAVGLNLGKVVINAFTVSKVVLVAFMVITAFTIWNHNPFASWEEFAPKGFGGVFEGSTLLFFGFIGFDEVCCLASKSKNPAKTMPRAIAGTLIGATILSASAQISLAGSVQSYAKTSFEEVFGERGLSAAKWIVTLGEAVLLPLVVYLSFLPQPELMAAVSEDGLLPEIFHRKNQQGLYVSGTILSGLGMMLVAFAVPFAVLWDVISLGVLLSFNLTSASLLQVRYGNGGVATDSRISKLVWALLVSSIIAGYALWHGLLERSFKHEQLSVPLTVIGAVLAVASLGFTATIAFTGTQIKDKDPGAVFRMCGVPWVPAAGMFFNAMMAAPISIGSHLFFLMLIAIFFAMYAGYKITRRVSSSSKKVKILEGRVAALEQENKQLRGQLSTMT